MIDLNNKKVALPLSGGINSAAVLCWLIESGMQPSQLYLYYAHFEEHSPDTMLFVQALMEYCKKYFHGSKTLIFTEITQNSVLDFFEKKSKYRTRYLAHAPGCLR